MIALIVSILVGWLLLKMLWPRAPLYSEPPPPQLVIHLHLIVPVKGDRRYMVEASSTPGSSLRIVSLLFES